MESRFKLRGLPDLKFGEYIGCKFKKSVYGMQYLSTRQAGLPDKNQEMAAVSLV